VSELISKTIAELRDGFRGGEFSAREIAEGYNTAVEAARLLNAYTVTTPDDALTAADAADKAGAAKDRDCQHIQLLACHGGRYSLVNLARLVKHRSMLLVLDNAEHLSDAVADAAATLAVDAELRLFITSREPLHIPNERVYRLSGLEVPETGVGSTEAMQAAAVALFVRCARNADANFAPDLATSDIAAICRRLDGLPLSIEMAASRVASLGVSGLKVALEQHWRLLTSRARATPLRHETLEATLDWSHALLHPDEQRTLRRLALFVNGFPLDAARAVTVSFASCSIRGLGQSFPSSTPNRVCHRKVFLLWRSSVNQTGLMCF